MTPFAHDDDLNLLPPADLATEIERLNQEVQNERDRNLRTLADFKNYRRRVERDNNKLAEEGKRAILLSLLDIIDDVENALQWTSEAEQAVVKGVDIIHTKLLRLLKEHGVLPFESAGTPFDPNLHDAVGMVRDKRNTPGTVVNELRRGYLWKNELLRPAQVRVSE